MAQSPSPPDSLLDITRWMLPEAREQVRSAIDECGGDEVFFVGFTNADGVVEAVEPCAFGNQNSVPVIEQMARPGCVVIHNHPSGDLRPSQADIEIASRLGSQGVGSFILDNTASHIRIIVKPIPPEERKFLDVRMLEKILGPGGQLSEAMSGYEHRPQQTSMLRAVTEAFNDDGIAVIEAGTGTGKSLAYLLPAIHWAKANKEKVVISTNTINLQEQLIAKDLPFLSRRLGLEFRAELMKGRNNYLCRRKAAYLRITPDFFAEETGAGQLAAILEWSRTTQDGSLSDLSFVPEFDIWEQVACDPDNCLRVRCQHYQDCHFFQARRRAALADLLVANHHLVMADLAVRLETHNYTSVAVLPPYKRLIFDEAHNVENVATQYFGIVITRRTLARLLNRLVQRERSHIGLLPFLRDRLILLNYKLPDANVQRAVTLLADTLIPLRQEVTQTITSLMDLCAEGVCDLQGESLRPRTEIKLRIVPDVEESLFWRDRLRRAIDAVTAQMASLSRGLREVSDILRKLPEEPRLELEPPAGELRSLSNRLASRADEFKNFHTVSENQCRWIEIYQRDKGTPPSVKLVSLPLEIQGHLSRSIYATTPTVVMTSATLSVESRFDFFLSQVGLDDEFAQSDTRDRVTTLQLDTPFDFDRQAFVGVPVDIPEPLERGFADSAAQLLLSALQISRGGAFVLFTSYSQLNDFYNRLAPTLSGLGYTCMKQGIENRQVLLQRFRNDRTSILFATSSFWEGVDVPGDALRLLVLVKLPFGVPTDPLLQARVERLEAKGVDAFQEYSVPQAVIRFKQGFGRLIRTREDRGAVLVLDKRVVTKRYGLTFLNSLPSNVIHRLPAFDLLADLQTFFAR
ncbi:MAG TPA: helicase C-terminal domain-containing protein [Candidatus Sumerlaeota bacterium]|mgnify:CR=1 FL=1|nr:helicase C-terminal domain-containing protein [Candidatus Sumerlaeota bacterium]HPS02821.1 helicase C-terminal domain-containing protein [Candidatus Sumerlaeota bacterium]